MLVISPEVLTSTQSNQTKTDRSGKPRSPFVTKMHKHKGIIF